MEKADPKPTGKGRKSQRICLNCGYMKHSKGDYYQGKCLFDFHSITNVYDHDYCKHWSFPSDYYEEEYTNEGWD